MTCVRWLSIIVAMMFLGQPAFAEFRSSKDMHKECRVALDMLQNRTEKNFQKSLSTGECIGYIQGLADASIVLAENVDWFKVCVPENVSTAILIQKFIAFVDKNPKYTVASTAFQLMLMAEFPCRKK
jgi:hypothetical protein